MNKNELLKAERALEAAAAAKAAGKLSDGALYLYIVAMLAADEVGETTEEALADAAEDLDITCMADGIFNLIN